MSQVNRSALIKVAKLYYYGNMSQEQIAKLMGISRPKVSRMLSMARELNIVEIVISDSPAGSEQMAEAIKQRFGLKYVCVVPAGATVQQSRLNAGRAAGSYLNTVLHDSMYIGVSWGTTMDCMVNQFTLERPVANATVVQIAGGMRTQSFNIDSRELSLLLAKKLGAQFALLQAPLLVSRTQVRDILLNEPEFAAHFKLFDKLDVALVGIGSELPEESVPYKAGNISLEQAKQLVKDGFATDICGHRIYSDGSIRENLLTGRVVAIPLERIREVPEVIGVAVGEDKARSIISAARGGFIKALITDEISAISIMGLEGLS